jgi:quinohemoprotein amine dehydrogenase
VGREPGRGDVYGEVRIEAKPGSDDEFATEISYKSAGGAAVARRGQSIVYTGYQWRGRSNAGDDALREVMFVDRDARTMTGRWFQGAYDEKGLDVTLVRIGTDPVVLGATPRALRAGSSASVTLHGVNLDRGLETGDIDLGPGVRLNRATRSEDGVVAEVEIAANAAVGERDVFVAGASRPRAIVVYKTVDALKLTPASGLARIGGARLPKRFEQFEAHAVSYGADGKAGTKDDLDLGLAPVRWSLEELSATFGDDDKDWAGTIDANGLFTPAEDGPNEKRAGHRNNVGDLWVLATLSPDSPLKPAAALRARAHLIVTVPLYMRWDQPEVMP